VEKPRDSLKAFFEGKAQIPERIRESQSQAALGNRAAFRHKSKLTK